jgi:hypothetical protein
MAFVKTEFSEELITYIIRKKRISELGTTAVSINVVTNNVCPNSLILFTLLMQVIRSSKTSVVTRATRRHIPKDDILQQQW